MKRTLTLFLTLANLFFISSIALAQDVTDPTLQSTNPVHQATGVSTTANIILTFNEP